MPQSAPWLARSRGVYFKIDLLVSHKPPITFRFEKGHISDLLLLFAGKGLVHAKKEVDEETDACNEGESKKSTP